VDSNDVHQGIGLSGQVAIVTGGGRGIGRAIALALAKDGMTVAVVAQTEQQLSETVDLIRAGGGKAVSFPIDVTDQLAVKQMVTKVEKQLGPVDLLVNNAGIFGPDGPISEVDPDEWWRCIAVNLRGPFLCTRAVVPGMIARHRGRVIITASDAALGSGNNMSAYAISKAGVLRLAEALAAECVEQGVIAFAIHPGLVLTAPFEAEAASPGDDKWFGGFFKKTIAEASHIPPERAAELSVFLASGKADALSGCYISVEDDVSEMVLAAHDIQENELHRLRLRR
jgi:NAD(P)-dependent dehydrogenase (short-subunit alcohol dehydrogenase family)